MEEDTRQYVAEYSTIPVEPVENGVIDDEGARIGAGLPDWC